MIDYSKDITEILLRAPEGLSIRKIVRHVYNTHNTLFEQVSLDDVKRDVTAYLLRRSKTKSSLIEHTGERGVYRINTNCQESKQLMLNFLEDEDMEEQPVAQPEEQTLNFLDFLEEENENNNI